LISVFFFSSRRRHTSFSRDWSSDVCSSDLMYNMGAANRNALNHSQTLEQRKEIIAEAAKQRWVEFEGGETKYTSGTVHELTENRSEERRVGKECSIVSMMIDQ